ncbi:MAG TPA: ATP synthase F0 subunit B [Verrucomicrobiae bacterium]|nr:ATP synthase F0 subunit B [Verrucomicrobiae bacterium]
MINYDEIAKWSDIISAILFLAVLVYLWFKFIQPAVLAAQEKSNELISIAVRHRDEAKASIDALNRELEGAQRDAGLIRERATGQAQREAEAMVEEARAAGERSLHNAQGELERARAAARQQLRDELAGQALDLARSQAQHRVDGAVNLKLVQSFMASLEHGGTN